MRQDVIPVEIRGVMPTSSGCAIFLGNDQKVFVIYVDQGIGGVISMALNGVKKERPLTHDLMHDIFAGMGVSLERIVINDMDEGTFFARLIMKMENELGVKLLEVDARPSDSIVLALLEKRPIFAAAPVFAQVEDMTEILERILAQENNPG